MAGDESEEGRDEIRPVEFVRSNGTLYSLSKEGVGSAGPLVTALTVAVTQAAEEYAKTQRGGRLAVPMLLVLVLVLDESANVCRWNNLPDLSSHYGSRWICIITILQSWSQGAEVWNEFGMKKLWTAANAKLYMGGVDETPAEDAPSLRFANVAEFVEVYLSRIYARETTSQGQRWCAEWWKHGEAIARLEALWRSWEVARLDPG